MVGMMARPASAGLVLGVVCAQQGVVCNHETNGNQCENCIGCTKNASKNNVLNIFETNATNNTL